MAIYNADVATYRQTVLTAFQQVEDYLAQTRILSQQIQQQRAAVASAQHSLDLEMGRYETGIDPYINVVTLQNTVFEQPADPDQSADRADDRRGAAGGSLRRWLGYLAAAHAVASNRCTQQGGYEDSAVSRWASKSRPVLPDPRGNRIVIGRVRSRVDPGPLLELLEQAARR